MKNKLTPVRDFIKGVHFSETDFSNVGSIEIIGENRVVVERTRNILEYENERVRLNLGKYIVSISGRDLMLSSYSENVMIIDGTIKSVALE